jgi:hypothetical protein
MNTKSRPLNVTLAIAEKIIRDIARREGEAIKKRRSRTMIGLYGTGYMVFEPNRNVLLSSGDLDGFSESLADLAKRYEDCERNTAWQNLVLAAIKNNRVEQTE